MSVNSLTVQAHFPADLYQGLRVRMCSRFTKVICLQGIRMLGIGWKESMCVCDRLIERKRVDSETKLICACLCKSAGGY